MLHKRLGYNQWFSLVCLMTGVILVQWPQQETVAGEADKKKNSLTGLIAVVLSCFSSGFSGVYFEKLIKFTQQSLWVRNIQLCIFGSFLSALTILAQDFKAVSDDGFFQGKIRLFN